MKAGLYRHYKGNFYQVLGLCRHSETLEELIIYQALYGDFGYWVRPQKMFQSTIVVDGKERPRFAFIRPLGEEAPAVR